MYYIKHTLIKNMSFNIPRDGNNRTIRINKTINSIPSLDQSVSIGSTGNTNFASVNSLSLNNVVVTATGTQLNFIDATPGVAAPSKALVLNASSNISGINNISCSNLIVNGVNITNSLFASASSDDAANIFMTNIVPGVAQASKALIFNSTTSVSNINTLSTQILNINNNTISNIKKNININNVYNSRLTPFLNIYSYILDITTTNTTNNTYIRGTFWSSICWSSKLLLYVAVCSGNGTAIADTRRVITSSNGIDWTLRTVFNFTFRSVCWCEELNIFVAVGSKIMTSPDGINWTLNGITLLNDLYSICWAKELSLFVAVSDTTKNHKIITSINGFDWVYRTGPGGIGLRTVCWSPELYLFVAAGGSASLTVEGTLVSSDGINWSLGTSRLNYSNSGAITWQDICWSPEKMLFIVTSTGNSEVYMYSSNGHTWTYTRDTNDSIASGFNLLSACWVKELDAFVGINAKSIGQADIIYSYNGYLWYLSTSITSNCTYKQLIWNPDYNQLIAIANNISANSVIVVLTPITSGVQNTNIGNSITFSKTNNNIGINTTSPNKLLEINSVNGNCFKQFCNTDNTKFVTYDVTNTGQLNLTTQAFVSIPTDYSTYGLKLNNVLLTTRISDTRSILSNITPGTAQTSKIIAVNANNDISGINNLYCNSIIVNNENIDLSTNNQYFSNSQLGTATASNALVTDVNINISNINNINTNKFNLNNSKINILNSYNPNLTTLKDKVTPYKDHIANGITNFKAIANTNVYSDCAWSPELGLFVAVRNEVISYSTNGITWTHITNLVSSYNIRCVCWSSELLRFIALGLSSSTTAVSFLSYNGINWSVCVNNLVNTNYNSICWSPELNIFAAITATNRISLSNNGYEWNNINITSRSTWNTIIWANKLNMFLASFSESTANVNSIMYSYNGINWTNVTLPFAMKIISMDWSEELNMLVAISPDSGVPLIYSYNGINWFANYTFKNNNYLSIKWISDLNCFILPSNASPVNIAYSFDGLNWKNIVTATTITISKFVWSPELKIIVYLTTSSTTSIVITNPILPSSINTLKSQSNEFICDNINNRVGLGVSNPSFQLHLSSDSAAKPSTSTWTVSSDERLKENIQDANLDTCYNNIKNIKLKKYTWKDEVYTIEQVADRSKLGWIAQEVETVFPKAVEKHNIHGYEDCRTLNNDQIIASMYGCAKQIINNYNNDIDKFNLLNKKIYELESFINSLPEE